MDKENCTKTREIHEKRIHRTICYSVPGDGINPLPYAAWRQQRNEPKLLEFLIEENSLNHTTDDQDPLNIYFSDRISIFAGITAAPTLAGV